MIIGFQLRGFFCIIPRMIAQKKIYRKPEDFKHCVGNNLDKVIIRISAFNDLKYVIMEMGSQFRKYSK